MPIFDSSTPENRLGLMVEYNYRLFKLLHEEGTAQQPRLFFKLYNANKGNDAVNISNIPNPSLVFHNILS